jgi:hypothetical protein
MDWEIFVLLSANVSYPVTYFKKFGTGSMMKIISKLLRGRSSVTLWPEIGSFCVVLAGSPRLADTSRLGLA